jgi:hypothetical protein
MSSSTEAVTETETEDEAESEWSAGTCSRCQRSHETVLSVHGYGPLCPACFNVLLEHGVPAVVERVEIPADSHTRSAVVADA